MGIQSHHTDHSSGIDYKDQVDKTPSNGFEELVSYQNKGKTSDEVEPDTNLPPISSFGALHILIEESEEDIANFSDDEIFEAGDDKDTDTHVHTEESSQHFEHTQNPPL